MSVQKMWCQNWCHVSSGGGGLLGTGHGPVCGLRSGDAALGATAFGPPLATPEDGSQSVADRATPPSSGTGGRPADKGQENPAAGAAPAAGATPAAFPRPLRNLIKMNLFI